jgi:predicted nucleic acid-binding protein
MVANTKKSLALDTNLLLDLAEGNDFAHDFREEFAGRGYSLVVPPTVLAELHALVIAARTPQCDFANTALEELVAWECEPFMLSATKLAIAHRFAERLLELRLIPETEPNDGKILAQTSLAKIPLLVTSDRHLLDVDEDALLLAFNDADLLPVHPAHPRRLLKALR